ncbi:MAG: FkbM family methyltransferase [Candidatus Magasanikbacteria bacterium]|nr:FkbM family methyltransferase [Candidatus Magasanikbacteria bacterium]
MPRTADLKLNGNNWQVHLRDEADESVFNEIFKLHEYRRAEEVIEHAKYPIVDAGAHAGFFSMYCRSKNKKVNIFAIEPEPNNIKLLREHIKKNKIAGVEVVEAALSVSSSLRSLLLSADSHNHKLAESEDFDKVLEVQAFSFLDFCKKYKIKKISLLKMDIEGGEYEVFDGMSEADLSVVNNIILEYHISREKSKEIEEKLRANGFGVQIFPSKFDKTMGFIFARNKRFNE